MCIRDSSYNNQEWNPVGSIARSNAHSRELGAILNTYLQVTPIEKLTLRTQFGANAHYRRSGILVQQGATVMEGDVLIVIG